MWLRKSCKEIVKNLSKNSEETVKNKLFKKL